MASLLARGGGGGGRLMTEFLRNVTSRLEKLPVGESILLPVIVSVELMLVVVRTSDRLFDLVVAASQPLTALKYHAVNAAVAAPAVQFRTALVIRGVPRRNMLDDVFWTAVYGLGNLEKFYTVLLPFVAGRPLEELLEAAEVEAAAVAAAAGSASTSAAFGVWRAPQRSETAYVRCFYEALHYLLTSRGLSTAQAGQVHCISELFCGIYLDVATFLVYMAVLPWPWVGAPCAAGGVRRHDRK